MNEVKDGISMLGDNINKIAEITEERKKERDKVTEAQLEISRNQLKKLKCTLFGNIVKIWLLLSLNVYEVN
ncbi:hypothetical protein E2562_037895 [Oryza meyeriana var. granulata]|uniref:Uncharacterized protein n=1 Tax=Oryza meyeriana var. granulata TaxID=110450 RepID=A0A6G1CD64_9ORYZ|nr:hypothetical protein E2562_001679 [Oryza meyeriana var. granulata]KAF0920980.1 hypothetical protein E2562_037895 [Oryza meyeriana var. granulata]